MRYFHLKIKKNKDIIKKNNERDIINKLEFKIIKRLSLIDNFLNKTQKIKTVTTSRIAALKNCFWLNKEPLSVLFSVTKAI